MTTDQSTPLCPTCGTKMRPAGICFVCEGCGATAAIPSAASALDKIEERMDALAPTLFTMTIQNMWLSILWSAHNGEAVQDGEGEALETPDFEGSYFSGVVLEPLLRLMLSVSAEDTITLEGAQALVESVIQPDLEQYGVRLKWNYVDEGLQRTDHLFVVPATDDEAVDET